mgnify:CR=1 FL=1
MVFVFLKRGLFSIYQTRQGRSAKPMLLAIQGIVHSVLRHNRSNGRYYGYLVLFEYWFAEVRYWDGNECEKA